MASEASEPKIASKLTARPIKLSQTVTVTYDPDSLLTGTARWRCELTAKMHVNFTTQLFYKSAGNEWRTSIDHLSNCCSRVVYPGPNYWTCGSCHRAIRADYSAELPPWTTYSHRDEDGANLKLWPDLSYSSQELLTHWLSVSTDLDPLELILEAVAVEQALALVHDYVQALPVASLRVT